MLYSKTDNLFTNEALVVSTVVLNKRLDSVTSTHVINIGVLIQRLQRNLIKNTLP